MKKILCAALLLAPLFAQAEAVGCNTVGDKAPATFLATDHADEIVHIRARPNTRAGIVVSCDNQSEVSMLGKTGAWYRVRTTLWGNAGNSSRTITGYVHQSQVSLRFETRKQAEDYAREMGLEYEVTEPHARAANIRPRGYGENFATDRRAPWTH